MNATERKKTESALRRVDHCSGLCKSCKHCELKTAGSYYAFYCTIADRAGYQPLSNTVRDLRDITRDCLTLELS